MCTVKWVHVVYICMYMRTIKGVHVVHVRMYIQVYNQGGACSACSACVYMHTVKEVLFYTLSSWSPLDTSKDASKTGGGFTSAQACQRLLEEAYSCLFLLDKTN